MKMFVCDNVTEVNNNYWAKFYRKWFTDYADPRTNDWFLVGDPLPGFVIVLSYLYFSLSWGPKFMRDKKPYELRKILMVYNFLQIVASACLFYEGLDAAWWNKYNWKCEPFDHSVTPETMRVARAVYFYFLCKISELLDTVFFVLRKNDRQITFLHLYHHFGMVVVGWGAVKYVPNGHMTFVGVINTFVHIIMYTYYFLSAFGPNIQKYLWWKKYITNLQMFQFCLIFLHSMQLLIYDCKYPKWTLYLSLPNAIFFYYLFNDFYRRAYRKQKAVQNGKINSEKLE